MPNVASLYKLVVHNEPLLECLFFRFLYHVFLPCPPWGRAAAVLVPTTF